MELRLLDENDLRIGDATVNDQDLSSSSHVTLSFKSSILLQIFALSNDGEDSKGGGALEFNDTISECPNPPSRCLDRRLEWYSRARARVSMDGCVLDASTAFAFGGVVDAMIWPREVSA